MSRIPPFCFPPGARVCLPLPQSVVTRPSDGSSLSMEFRSTTSTAGQERLWSCCMATGA